MSKIFKYIIISSLFLLGLLFNATAQEDKPAENDTVKTPFFQGLFVEFDVAPLVESALVNKYAQSVQGNVMANIKNRFFPVVELGFAHSSLTNSKDGYFTTSGLFEKIGMDFRLIKPNPKATIINNFVLGGLRLGMSHFNYSLTNMEVEDGYWGGSEIIDENSLSSTKIWFEIVAGMRVSIYKNIYMGWNVRNKRLLNNSKEGEVASWYIPGYGINNTSAWGFSYIVGYRF